MLLYMKENFKREKFMKRIKYIITSVFIIALIAGYWYFNVYSGGAVKSTQFLFDTTCTVTAYGKNAKEAVSEVFLKIEKINSLTNFYSENSEVSKINSEKANTEIKVSKDILEILSVALDVSKRSGGAFDVTVAPVTELWDFKSGKNTVPDKEDIFEAVKNVGYENIELNTQKSVIIKKNDSVKIDLGGAAKGYACDEAIKILNKYGVCGIVDLGGNVSCTGENPKSKDKNWRIGLQVPFKPSGEYEKVIEIKSGSVVTSGVYQRYFYDDNRLYHHIINPSDGFPENAEYNAVTVLSDSSLLADCLSTACFVLGKEDGKKLAEKFGAEIYYY